MPHDGSHPYDFAERWTFSQGVSKDASIAEILLRNIPGATKVERADKHDDRHGTDYWVTILDHHRLSVDLKARECDWSVRAINPKDDVAIETFSVIEKGVPGWSRDPSKRTDYVLWFWEPTGRWMLVPFHLLCKVTGENWQSWKDRFGAFRQHTTGSNGDYHSECVFVPRREVWALIYRKFGGAPKQLPRPSEVPIGTQGVLF